MSIPDGAIKEFVDYMGLDRSIYLKHWIMVGAAYFLGIVATLIGLTVLFKGVSLHWNDDLDTAAAWKTDLKTEDGNTVIYYKALILSEMVYALSFLITIKLKPNQNIIKKDVLLGKIFLGILFAAGIILVIMTVLLVVYKLDKFLIPV
jgi:hypothetical protein